MATRAQIDANRQNAQLSTGPITDKGKAAAARNHLTLGLYTQEDYVKPEEHDIYHAFCDTLLMELNPAGILEEALTHEIAGAIWRLRRCSGAEAQLGDFADSSDKLRRSIERARASSHSVLHRSINQLRKLQTERLTCGEFKKVVRNDELVKNTGLASNCETPQPESASNCNAGDLVAGSFQNAPQIARNAPCPCRSGEKYKRCCGKNAPPVLGKAA